ncbi:hypothetical protein HD554DRAFT_1225795 [Boletus coccyginus]|nr:hypothetical protein HD554DRAFT_1225795 [Boletus coccyginus]
MCVCVCVMTTPRVSVFAVYIWTAFVVSGLGGASFDPVLFRVVALSSEIPDADKGRSRSDKSPRSGPTVPRTHENWAMSCQVYLIVNPGSARFLMFTSSRPAPHQSPRSPTCTHKIKHKSVENVDASIISTVPLFTRAPDAVSSQYRANRDDLSIISGRLGIAMTPVLHFPISTNSAILSTLEASSSELTPNADISAMITFVRSRGIIFVGIEATSSREPQVPDTKYKFLTE